jgi:pyruvate decarboxylase
MHELINKTNLPIFVTPMGKGSVDETNPRYGGVYIGALSTPAVKIAVETSDLVLHIGGHKTDLNTGSFSFAFSASKTVEFHSDKIKIRYASYPGIAMKPVLRKVIDGLDCASVQNKYPCSFRGPSPTMPNDVSTTQEIEHAWFWPRLQTFLKPDDIVITDAGTAFFGLLDVHFPRNVMSINQLMWSAIGYSVGAALGACLGVRDMHLENERRVILIVGDGSLQISVQELSTMIWKGLKPVIFVLNNAGYTVERFIHGPEAEYNDINAGNFSLPTSLSQSLSGVNEDWEYTSLLKTFGAKKSSSFRVTTKTECDKLLSSKAFATGEEIQLVDVVMPVMDAPRALKEQARLLENANRKADDDEPPPKKRKVETATATMNGIGFHGLTNGAETLN